MFFVYAQTHTHTITHFPHSISNNTTPSLRFPLSLSLLLINFLVLLIRILPLIQTTSHKEVQLHFNFSACSFLAIVQQSSNSTLCTLCLCQKKMAESEWIKKIHWKCVTCFFSPLFFHYICLLCFFILIIWVNIFFSSAGFCVPLNLNNKCFCYCDENGSKTWYYCNKNVLALTHSALWPLA